jgi:hypothetical protein
MKRLNLIMAGFLALFLILPAGSCGLVSDVFADKVITAQDNVKEEYKDTIIKPPLEGTMPAEKIKELEAAGKTPVIVDKIAVKDESKAVEVSNPSSDALGAVLGIGIDAAKIFFPGVVGLEFIGALLSQRKRQHYAQAIKALVPYDGKVEVTSAIVSIGKALGLKHSSEVTKNVFAEETRQEKPQA